MGHWKFWNGIHLSNIKSRNDAIRATWVLFKPLASILLSVSSHKKLKAYVFHRIFPTWICKD